MQRLEIQLAVKIRVTFCLRQLIPILDPDPALVLRPRDCSIESIRKHSHGGVVKFCVLLVRRFGVHHPLGSRSEEVQIALDVAGLDLFHRGVAAGPDDEFVEY